MADEQPNIPADDGARARYIRCMHELAGKFKVVVDALVAADEAARAYRAYVGDAANNDLLVAMFDVGREAFRLLLTRAGDALLGTVPILSTVPSGRTEA